MRYLQHAISLQWQRGTVLCGTVGALYQGRRHEVLMGGGGYGHLDPPTPKISFSSDFGHFILGKNIGKCKILILVKKVTENFISGERPPLIYRQRSRVPVPCLPVSTPILAEETNDQQRCSRKTTVSNHNHGGLSKYRELTHRPKSKGVAITFC